jgi:hypothetical protein
VSGFSSNCRRSTSAYLTNSDPNTRINYPLWGLGQ